MIRTLSLQDLHALVTLEDEVFTSGPWTASQLASQIGDKASVLLGHWSGDDLTAYVALRVVSDEAELLRIGVLPAARRSGVARALLRDGVSACSGRGARRLFLEVSEHNGAALALYGATGWSKVGRRRGYYGPGDDAILLRIEPPPTGAGR